MLAEKLDAEGIRGFRWTIGTDQKLLCPRCEGGRTKEKSLSFKLDEEGGAVWNCKRAHCGWAGNIVGEQRSLRRPAPKRDYTRPTIAPSDPTRPLIEWFAKRGISEEVVRRFEIYRTMHFVPQVGAEVPVTAFPYRVEGELYGVKYRYDYMDDGKPAKTFTQEKDSEPSLFNADRGLAGDTVYFVEGEMDVLAMAEAGYEAVSLRDGAPSPKKGGTPSGSDKRYGPLRTHWERLSEAKRFVLAGDIDEPGRLLMDELARRLGREKCKIVTWPEKDANDTLIRHGRDVLRAHVEAAEPYPIEGLYNLSPDDLLVLEDTSWQMTVTTGSDVLDALFQVPVQGRFWVVTGIPGSGKSTFIDWLLVNLARIHGWRAALFSPETRPWQIHGKRLCEIHCGKSWYGMTQAERVRSVTWIGQHFTHIEPPGDGDIQDLDWLIEKIRVAVLRDGVRSVVVDPWNELEHTRPRDVTTAEYTNRVLPKLKNLCYQFGVNVFLIAHPRKLEAGEVPTGYSIADAAAFANKADFGVTVHRPTATSPETLIRVWKVRFKAHGKRGDCLLIYDRECDRYSDAAIQPE